MGIGPIYIQDLLSGLFILILSIKLVRSKIHSQENRIFILLLISTAIWILNVSLIKFLISFNSHSLMLTDLTRLSFYFGTITISLIFKLIIDKFGYLKNKHEITVFIIISEIIFAYFILFSDFYIKSVEIPNGYNLIWHYGKFSFFIDFYYLLILVLITTFGIKKIKEIDHESKAISLIIFIGFIPSLFTNLILPRFNIYEYEWLVSITIPVSILLIVYYIVKKNIFKIKVENYEFIIYLLIIFCFSLLVKNNNSNAIIDKIVLFIVVAFLCLITTRNMTNIKHQSEHIEKITKDMLSS